MNVKIDVHVERLDVIHPSFPRRTEVHYILMWPLEKLQTSAHCRFNPYSAGIDFSCQNLTSVDVRFWRQKSIPAL